MNSIELNLVNPAIVNNSVLINDHNTLANIFSFTYFTRTIIAIACFLVILLSFLGNTLVVFVILHFKRLKNPTNYILLSLAITDLAVSFLVMFPSMIQDTLQKWIFSNLFCKMYVGFDISCCTASILHLLLVAVDRYIAIFNPLTYKNLVRTWHVVLMVLVVWTLSFGMSFLPIFMGWNELSQVVEEPIMNSTSSLITNENSIDFSLNLNNINLFVTHSVNDSFDQTYNTTVNSATDEYFYCFIEANIPYAIISSSLSFWIPLVIMTIVYIQIYIVAKRQQNAIAQLDIRASNFNQQSSETNTINLIMKQSTKKLSKENGSQKTHKNSNILNEQELLKINQILTENDETNKTVEDSKADKKSKFLKLVKQLKSIERKRTKDTKAIKTLGIIMGIFILCWLPFFIMYVWVGLTKIPFPLVIERLITWIGYINSFINPIIYALTNKDFRKAYKTTLKDLFKKCCTRAFYNSRFGKNDANNFYSTNHSSKRKNNANNQIFSNKFINFFKCCSCCSNDKNLKTPIKQNDPKQADIITENQKVYTANQKNESIIENDSSHDKTNQSIVNRNNFIVFNEEIQEFSYIDNEPISVDNLKSIEKIIQPVSLPEISNKIEPVSLVDETKLVLNVDEPKLELIEDNNNNINNDADDISSSPETVSSSEKSRVVARKKIFFKLKKDKTKATFENEFESDPLNVLSSESVDLNSDTRLNSFHNRRNLSEKSGFSFRKSFFKSKKLNNKTPNKFDNDLEQLNSNGDKNPSLLKTIMDENDEDSDCTYTNTDTTSTKRNSISNEKPTSARSNSKFKRIFSKKNSKGEKSLSSLKKDSNNNSFNKNDLNLNTNMEAIDTSHVCRV